LRQYAASIKANIPASLKSYIQARDQTLAFFACASCGVRESQVQRCHVRRRLSELSPFQFDDVADAERRRRIAAVAEPYRRIFSVYGLHDDAPSQ
jgi:predicted RNA-binding Zn-ribbon protein involved in translation (DUF1610 family)